MKRFLKALVAVFAIGALAGCSKVSEKYAEKINVAEAKNEPLLYSEVLDDLGQPHVDLTATLFGSTNGWATWYKGYDSAEEADAAYEAGKTVAYITITVSDNKATNAEYGEKTKEAE